MGSNREHQGEAVYFKRLDTGELIKHTRDAETGQIVPPGWDVDPWTKKLIMIHKYPRRLHPEEVGLPPLPANAPGAHDCPKCGKTFASHLKLFNHYELHINQKRYVCESCGEAFNLYESYRTHVKKGCPPRRGSRLTGRVQPSDGEL